MIVGLPAVIFGFVVMVQWNKAAALLDKVDRARAIIETSKPSVIVSSDGQVLYRASTEYREVIERFGDVPKVVKDATLAAEDKRFYQHGGIDYWAMFRMLFTNAREGRLAQGGSTLTMQLAKRIASTGEKTFARKLQDVCLAIQMEKRLTKDQILLLYLNQVYYGSGAYGVKAAANVYFGKRLDQLTPSDAALLARMVRRPSKENAFDDLDAALKNRDVVLTVMLDEGMINQAQYDKALKEKPVLRRRSFGSGEVTYAAPYFVQHVKTVLAKEMPEVKLSEGGYTVQTTLDMRLQKLAEHEVRKVVASNRRRRVTTAAFVLMDADGKILAMVGGVDFKRNQYNVVTQGRRQPGSAFKPFVYATALATGAIGPNDTISNARLFYDDGYGNQKEIHNSGGKYGGRRTVESAIANSVNVCAARVLQTTGAESVVDYAHRVFGFQSELQPYLSLALGGSEVSPLEMAQGYSVFMLQGDRATPFTIRRVIGPDGRTLKEFEPNVVRGVLGQGVTMEMDRFLRAVVTRGTASHFQSSMPPNSRGKTGTTSENRDAWFCGYTDNLVGIGWVGNERYDSHLKHWVYDAMASDTFGGTVTVRIWAGVMKEADRLVGVGFRRTESSSSRDRKPEREKTDESVTPAPTESTTPPETVAPENGAAAPPNADGTASTGDPTPVTTPPTVDPGATPAREPRTPAVAPVRTPDKPKAPKAKPAEPQYVEVEICADSGMLASIYCPETVRRRFIKGKQPRKRCNIHLPSD